MNWFKHVETLKQIYISIRLIYTHMTKSESFDLYIKKWPWGTLISSRQMEFDFTIRKVRYELWTIYCKYYGTRFNFYFRIDHRYSCNANLGGVILWSNVITINNLGTNGLETFIISKVVKRSFLLLLLDIFRSLILSYLFKKWRTS